MCLLLASLQDVRIKILKSIPCSIFFID
jgi:hypothetical protein